MKKNRFKEEQIIQILRSAETPIIEAAPRQHGVSEQSVYRWKRQFDKWTWMMCGSCGTHGSRMPGWRRSLLNEISNRR